MPDPIKRILVATDLTDGSLQALRFAHRLAVPLGAGLNLVYVWSYRAGFPIAGDPEDAARAMERDARGQFDAFIAIAFDEGIIFENAYLISGKPVDEVLKLSYSEPFDFIVVGTAGRTGAARLFSGSVAEEIIRAAGIPVVTVRIQSES
ncbi:MAG: universal stress protein [Myxococcota bacterium]